MKLLSKVLREYVTSIRELNNLPFKHILRLAAHYVLLSLDEVDRWLLHRDNHNTSAHEYRMQFTEKIVSSLPTFISDTHAVLATPCQQALFVLNPRPKDLSLIQDLMTRHLPADVAVWAYGSRVNGNNHEGSYLDLVLRTPDLTTLHGHLLSEFRETLTDSNLPIFVDTQDWTILQASFRPRILARYKVLRPRAAALAVPI